MNSHASPSPGRPEHLEDQGAQDQGAQDQGAQEAQEASGTGLDALAVGDALPPLVVPLSEAANERTWAAAGIDHPARRAGALFPPFAANLTIMALQAIVDRPFLHTAQHLVCHRRARAGVDLTVRTRVEERYERRDRAYVVVEAVVLLPGDELLWTSRATFTEAATGRAA